MNILGKEISEKTASLIKEIEQRLSKPVMYRFTDPSKTTVYGQCDPWQPDAYYVYCKESLLNTAKKNQVNIAYETNLLHELSHLCQIEEGFPHTCTRNTPVTMANKSHYDNLGALFVSSILDLNVDFRLKQNGYASKYFYTQRIIRAEKIARKGHVYKGLDFLEAALMLMLLKLTAAPASVNQLLHLLSDKNQGLVICCTSLAEAISQIGYNDPKSAFRSLACLFGTFNLFETHSIIFCDKEYTDFSSAERDYPGTRIVSPPAPASGDQFLPHSRGTPL